MPHDTPLIATIVIGLCLAFIFGAIATRLKISPLVGYLLAGVIAGPHTPGFVADQDLILQLAEIGVILLMFGVGLHFSLKDLLSVKAIAVPGALAQIAAAVALGTGLGLALGWDVQAGLVFGLALSTASTVVLLRAMQERRLIDTERGRIAVGWLIVEDLAMVMALVLLPAVASVTGRAEGSAASDPIVSWLGLGIGGIILLTIAKVVLFVALMLIVGRKVIRSPSVWRFLRIGRILRRHGDERIRTQPSSRGGVPPLARRFRSAVLHLCRHVVRPDESTSRSAAPARNARHHSDR